jgi:hypothetical protein
VGAIGVLRIGEVFPADTPHPGTLADALAGEDLAHLAAGVAWLVQQRERLKALSADPALGVQRTHTQVVLAFIADHDQRLAVPCDDQQRLFIARIEVGEVRQVREVLAIRIDDHVAEPLRVHTRPQRRNSAFKFRGLHHGRAIGPTELRPLDVNQLMGFCCSAHLNDRTGPFSAGAAGARGESADGYLPWASLAEFDLATL